MITVFGRATSSNVQAVMWTVAELGLAHERVDWGGAHGGNDDPAYRAMSPQGLIPAIRDAGAGPGGEDLTMFESAAIVRYLGARYGDAAFWPRDPAARGALDQWAEWAKIAFCATLIGVLFMEIVRKKPADRDPAAIARGTEALAGLARIADARIADGRWLGGDHLSFADVMLGHGLYRYHTLEFERVATPRLTEYYRRLTERPAYAEHVMVSYDGLRV